MSNSYNNPYHVWVYYTPFSYCCQEVTTIVALRAGFRRAIIFANDDDGDEAAASLAESRRVVRGGGERRAISTPELIAKTSIVLGEVYPVASVNGQGSFGPAEAVRREAAATRRWHREWFLALRPYHGARGFLLE